MLYGFAGIGQACSHSPRHHAHVHAGVVWSHSTVSCVRVFLLQAAGLKHIGFGPFKRENQDEFFIQVGNFGKQHSSNLFCVFDGHGSHGKDAAYHSRQLLPRLLDAELGYHLEVGSSSKQLACRRLWCRCFFCTQCSRCVMPGSYHQV